MNLVDYLAQQASLLTRLLWPRALQAHAATPEKMNVLHRQHSAHELMT